MSSWFKDSLKRRHIARFSAGVILLVLLTGCSITISGGPPSSGGSSSNSVSIGTSPPPVWTAQQWVALLSADESSVVKITTYTSLFGSQIVAGSGFFTNGVIVTCNHVIANAHYFIDVWFHGGAGPYHAYVVATDPAQDLAILKLDNGYDPGNLPLGSLSNQTDGESVAIVGHPGGGSLYIAPGTLTHMNATLDVTGYGQLSPMLSIEAPAIGGDSGGPVFDTNGHVIGVLEDGSVGVTGQGGAVPVSALYQFLQANGL